MKKSLFALSLFLLMQAVNLSAVMAQDEPDASFDAFLKKFTSSAEFQYSRVKFPVATPIFLITANGDEQEVPFTQEEWPLLGDKELKEFRQETQDGVYFRHFTVRDKDHVEFEAGLEESELDLSVIFDLIDGKWYVTDCFNGIYGETFKIPEPYIPKAGARIMGLTNPESKMSKSIPEGCVFLMEKPEDIQRKFKRAITDSDTEHCVRFDPEHKPGVSNLMNIYSAVTGKTMEEIQQEFDGQGYGAFKPAVGDAVIEALRPIREEATRILADKAYLESVYKQGAEKAGYVANKTLRKVYKKVGFLPR